MGAKRKELTAIQETMLHSLNWLEQSFDGHCGVLDIDWISGGLTLFGRDCAEYREKFNSMIKGVYDG